MYHVCICIYIYYVIAGWNKIKATLTNREGIVLNAIRSIWGMYFSNSSSFFLCVSENVCVGLVEVCNRPCILHIRHILCIESIRRWANTNVNCGGVNEWSTRNSVDCFEWRNEEVECYKIGSYISRLTSLNVKVIEAKQSGAVVVVCSLHFLMGEYIPFTNTCFNFVKLLNSCWFYFSLRFAAVSFIPSPDSIHSHRREKVGITACICKLPNTNWVNLFDKLSLIISGDLVCRLAPSTHRLTTNFGLVMHRVQSQSEEFYCIDGNNMTR